ncbi:MFS transporter [Paraburkholderia bryophila]|uniref:MFS transporter n=1 Tax=Paraburkholderia bryophila TaxID=420952 RepID=UPI00234ABAC4|nr:MFS transporter [Paraburkholderia bryophila]WCM18276.1 MFS transporter [Paraburkholderia bryophila]
MQIEEAHLAAEPPAELAGVAARSSVRWKIFWLLLLLSSINYIDRASLSIALPMISAEFSLTPAMEGVLLSSFFWTYAFMQIPSGILVDRFKSRNIIGIATIVWGGCQAIAAGCFSWIPLLLTRLGLGIAEAPIMPAGAKLAGAWLTPNERGRGATLLDGGAPLGSAFGAIIISALIAFLGSWRLAFVVAGVGTVVVGIFAWRYIRNHPSEHPGVNRKELAHIVADQNARSATRAQTQAVPFRQLLKDRSVLFMFMSWACYNSVFYGLMTWMPNYLHKAHGFDLKQMGGATFIIFMCGFIGELFGGWAADKWRAAGTSPNVVMKAMFSSAGLVAAIAILAVAFVKQPVAVVALLSLALFFLRWCGMFWGVPATLGGQARAGALAGAMNFCGNIVGVIVPILIGVIVQVTGTYFLALMFFVVAAGCLALCASAIDYRERGLA